MIPTMYLKWYPPPEVLPVPHPKRRKVGGRNTSQYNCYPPRRPIAHLERMPDHRPLAVPRYVG